MVRGNSDWQKKPMTCSIYIRANFGEGLRDFANRLFHTLDIQFGEERESLNYPGGRYIIGASAALRFTVTFVDNPEFADYRFELYASPQQGPHGAAASLDGYFDALARFLEAKGYKLTVSLGARIGSGRVTYGE
jgi:hypothetical protein